MEPPAGAGKSVRRKEHQRQGVTAAPIPCPSVLLGWKCSQVGSEAEPGRGEGWGNVFLFVRISHYPLVIDCH